MLMYDGNELIYVELIQKHAVPKSLLVVSSMASQQPLGSNIRALKLWHRLTEPERVLPCKRQTRDVHSNGLLSHHPSKPS